MIVYGCFTHPEELLWVMKIKDCQMLAASEISFLWKTFSERFSGRKMHLSSLVRKERISVLATILREHFCCICPPIYAEHSMDETACPIGP